MNIGHSSRLSYDGCAYNDRLKESTGPLGYKIATDQIYNCKSCLPIGATSARASNNGIGNDVSRTSKTGFAPKQDLIDVDSIMSNRNVKLSKCKSGKTNPIDLTKMQKYDQPYCDNMLDRDSSRLSHPATSYKGVPINRFYNLPNDPQANIFWNGAVNSKLEAKDNHQFNIVKPWGDNVHPVEKPRQPERCVMKCTNSNLHAFGCNKY